MKPSPPLTMNYTRYDLGQRRGGETVVVTLRGNAANVRLMDSSAFSSFKRGAQHKYHGGHYNRSPVRLQIPRAGHWYVVIDLGGHPGRVNSSVQVLPGLLPAGREAPLSSVPSLVRQDPPPGVSEPSREYDVFISHASEDKETIVAALVDALLAERLTVWYDDTELRIGDSLRRKIDAGVAKSRVGLVVLSKAFMGKNWTNYELDGIVTRSVTEEQVLLPIWHGVTKSEVIAFSPSIADKLARSTATHTVEEIASEIAALLQSQSV